MIWYSRQLQAWQLTKHPQIAYTMRYVNCRRYWESNEIRVLCKVETVLLQMKRLCSASSKPFPTFPAIKSFSKNRRYTIPDLNRLPLKYRTDNRPFDLAHLSTWRHGVKFNFETFCHVYGVTVNKVSIINRIYWTFLYTQLVITIQRLLSHTNYCFQLCCF